MAAIPPSVELGMLAPDFRLPATDGRTYSLADVAGRTGTAIVFISHRLEELFALADRVTVLRDGTYVGTRDMASVKIEELIRMMVGRTLGELFPKEAVQAGDVVLEVEGLGVEGSFSGVSFQLRRGEIGADPIQHTLEFRRGRRQRAAQAALRVHVA